MKIATLLFALLLICACGSKNTANVPSENSAADTKTAEPVKTATVTPGETQTAPEVSLSSACETMSGYSKDRCIFEIEVNSTIKVSKCIEEKTDCMKNRNYADCVEYNKYFGCTPRKEADAANCGKITNDSMHAQCDLYLSFAYDDISRCSAILDKEVKEVCLYGFIDREIDCKYLNFPCRTTHELTQSDCDTLETDAPARKLCESIVTKDAKKCADTGMPICEMIFADTFSYTADGKTYSHLIYRPDLENALKYITANTSTDSKIFAGWDLGHMIRSYGHRDAVMYNVPMHFQPSDADAKKVFQLADLYSLSDKPYYDTDSWGPQEADDLGMSTARIFMQDTPEKASEELKTLGASYVLTSVQDIQMLPMYLDILGIEEPNESLINDFNNLKEVKGFELVYSDDNAALYAAS